MSDIRMRLSRFVAQRPTMIAMTWLAITFLWVVVIFVTDFPAWSIAIWIATTIAPITALRKAHRKPMGG